MKYIKLTEDIKALAQTKFLELINSVSVVEADLTIKLNTKELMNTTGIEKPTIIVEAEASNKLWSYVNLCEKEIGWHGTVVREGNTFYIKDVFLFPQTVTAATVTTDDDAYSTWILSQEDEVFEHMRFHGHSHVNMGVTPSGTDITYQANLLRDVTDFYIFGIFNKRGLMNFCIYDIETNILFEQNDIVVQDYCTEYDSVIEDEIDRFVQQTVVIPQSYGTASKACPPSNINKYNREEDWAEKYYSYGYNGYGY